MKDSKFIILIIGFVVLIGLFANGQSSDMKLVKHDSSVVKTIKLYGDAQLPIDSTIYTYTWQYQDFVQGLMPEDSLWVIDDSGIRYHVKLVHELFYSSVQLTDKYNDLKTMNYSAERVQCNFRAYFFRRINGKLVQKQSPISSTFATKIERPISYPSVLSFEKMMNTTVLKGQVAPLDIYGLNVTIRTHNKLYFVNEIMPKHGLSVTIE